MKILLLTALQVASNWVALTHAQSCADKNSTDSSCWPYRDASLSIDDRLDDLLSRMTIEEKAGQMYHARALQSANGQTNTRNNIANKFISHFVYQGGINDVDAFIDWHNDVQELAASTRLGIPITFSTDPQHGWTQDTVTGNIGRALSRWTEPMGLAALRDPDFARQYADVVRQELAAVGLRQVLYPQVDLATEPRWGRFGATLGEDSSLTSSFVVSMLAGFRGQGGIKDSVIATVKHFPGAGAQENGEDAHFPWGTNTVWPGNNLEEHLIPFQAAIDAGAPQVMPYYSRPKGNPEWENIGFAFNKPVITGLLKNQMGFEGIILTDFGILSIAPWGLEDKSVEERTWFAVEAGVDIIGGESSPSNIVSLVGKGLLNESRIDESVRKLLKQKFELGLFDNPYSDKEAAAQIIDNEEFRRLGMDSQRRSMTLLTNDKKFLPLRESKKGKALKVYAENIPESSLQARGLQVVDTPTKADVAILRLVSPFGPPDPAWPAAAAINNGSLEFDKEEQKRQKKIYNAVPTIVDIKMNRPAVIPEIAKKAKAVFASYGSSPEALLDVIFNVNGAAPEGRLPFDLPSKHKWVENSKEDLPFDTKKPLFEYGHGLRYK
ncbi:hypothetical protein MBLNU230_g0598t1 [Neophaeotheca triangularis]